jgi:hypothetical protein
VVARQGGWLEDRRNSGSRAKLRQLVDLLAIDFQHLSKLALWQKYRALRRKNTPTVVIFYILLMQDGRL